MIWRGLLVSVRDATEAEAALEGGAAIIDVKDPTAGSLGAASATAVAAVAATVGPRAPWTVAAGELRDEIARPGGVQRWLAAIAVAAVHSGTAVPAAVKIGLAGLAGSAWQSTFHELMEGLPAATARVAVAYADWQRAQAPHPLEIVTAARHSCGVLLIDTADKSGPDLQGACHRRDLQAWVAEARDTGMAVALAGRVRIDSIPDLGRLGPDVVALRSAVCSNSRLGPVDATLVRRAASAVRLLEMPHGTTRTSCSTRAEP